MGDAAFPIDAALINCPVQSTVETKLITGVHLFPEPYPRDTGFHLVIIGLSVTFPSRNVLYIKKKLTEPSTGQKPNYRCSMEEKRKKISEQKEGTEAQHEYDTIQMCETICLSVKLHMCRFSSRNQGAKINL